MGFIEEGRSQAAIDGCYVCPMCRHQCTTLKATRQETDSPRSKALSLYSLQRGLLALDDPGMVAQMYRCCGCRLCTAWCISGYEPSSMVQAARTAIVQKLKAPQRVMELLDRILDAGNPMGHPMDERGAVLDGLASPADKQPQVLLYAGCSPSYEERDQVRAAARLLDAAGVSWTTLRRERCCGAVAWSLGFRREAQDMAAAVLEGIEQSGATTVVTTCPSCAKAIGNDYSKEWGVKPRKQVEVLHITQLLARLMDQGKLVFKKAMELRAAYHDPCSLGRGMGVYEEPRRVLAAIGGLELVESRHNREKGECCGSGAGMRFTNPEIAATAASQTLEGKLATGAQMVVTACPSCQTALRGARERLGVNVPVVDLVSLAESAL